MTYTWFKSDQIAGGSAIDLKGRTLKLTWDMANADDTIPGKDSTDTYANKLNEIDTFAIMNPRYTLTGVIDTLQTTNAAASVCLTVPLVRSFMTLGSPVWFYDDKLITNPAGSCHVMLTNFNTDRDISTAHGSDAGYFLGYTWKFTETKAW